MGTNFYGMRISKVKEIEDQQERIEKELRMLGKTSIELDDILDEYFKLKKESLEERIHIGKLSGSWEFLFNLNNKRPYRDKPTLIEWLKTVQIEDEYGIQYSFNDFWNDIVNDRKYLGKPAKKHSLHGNNYISIDGLEFLDTYFC